MVLRVERMFRPTLFEGRRKAGSAMAEPRCKHCGKYVRQINGEWHHYWWVKDKSVAAERRLKGSPFCCWLDAPAELTKAEP